jgi:hypothetical protein
VAVGIYALLRGRKLSIGLRRADLVQWYAREWNFFQEFFPFKSVRA